MFNSFAHSVYFIALGKRVYQISQPETSVCVCVGGGGEGRMIKPYNVDMYKLTHISKYYMIM